MDGTVHYIRDHTKVALITTATNAVSTDLLQLVEHYQLLAQLSQGP